MLLEQTHFPQTGPNWGTVIFVTLGAAAIGYMVYNLTIRQVPKTRPPAALLKHVKKSESI